MQYVFIKGVSGLIVYFERPQQDYDAWKRKSRDKNGHFIN